MTDRIVSQLERVQLFSALDRDDLAAIAEVTQEKAHPRGASVFQQGEPGSGCYLLRSGQLRVLRVDTGGVEREVGRLGPGDFFGESSLLLGEPHDASVEVVTDAVLLIIDKSDFDRLVAQRPSILNDLRMTTEIAKRRLAPRFDWQEPDEVVVFVLHKHNVVLLCNLLLPGLALLLILVAFFFVGSTSLAPLVLAGLLSAIPVLFALYQIVDHFNDNYILTNRRVVHDEQVYLIRRSRVGAPLHNIQSIQRVQEGVLARSFDFGDLLIETAGEPGGLVAFRQVPNPALVHKRIFEERARVEAQARAEERAAIQNALHRRLEEGEIPAEDLKDEEEKPVEEDGQTDWSSWIRAPLRLFNYFFPSLCYEEGDTITWRKHWISLLGPIARPTAAIAVVTLIAGWLLGPDSDQVSVLLSYAIVLMFLVPWWLWVFEDWQNDIYQVTSSRIIDIEQRPFGLREERREASLGMVQNVSLRVPGLIGRVLGYGSVTIETAGAGAFTFDCVKNPEAVQTEIFRRVEGFEKRERQKRAQRRRDELLDWFTVYDQMRHPEDQQEGGPVSPAASERGGASDTAPSTS
ncbi:MAG: cyclic nucleotide-binding domain-containing protein [Anaerolineae bacterium]